MSDKIQTTAPNIHIPIEVAEKINTKEGKEAALTFKLIELTNMISDLYNKLEIVSKKLQYRDERLTESHIRNMRLLGRIRHITRPCCCDIIKDNWRKFWHPHLWAQEQEEREERLQEMERAEYGFEGDTLIGEPIIDLQEEEVHSDSSLEEVSLETDTEKEEFHPVEESDKEIDNGPAQMTPIDPVEMPDIEIKIEENDSDDKSSDESSDVLKPLNLDDDGLSSDEESEM